MNTDPKAIRGWTLVRVLLLVLGTAACTEPAPVDDDGTGDTEVLPPTLPGLPFDRRFTAAEDLPPPPSCELWAPGWSLPVLPESDGPIYAYPDAWVHPVGAEVRVRFHVYRYGDSALDVDFQGPLSVAVDPPTATVEVAELQNGEGALRVIFAEEATHTITFDDPASSRWGTVQLFSYAPRLPVWELSLAPEDLDWMNEDPYEQREAPATLRTPVGEWPGTLRLRGGSSREFIKKSFRFDLEDGELPDGSDTVVLRAEWRDKTQLRNLLALDLIRAATWLPAPRPEPVALRINGEPYGAMLRVDRIDGTFLEREGLRGGGNLYEADPPNSHSVPGGNLTPLLDPADYPIVYDEHSGDGHHRDLRDLIEVELAANGDEGTQALWDSVAVEDAAVMLAIWTLLQDHDHIRKNYYLYRDPGGIDDRFLPIPWDLDLTFGHLWSEEEDIFDESVTWDSEPLVGLEFPEHGFFNRLADDVFRDEDGWLLFHEALGTIVGTAFTEEYLNPRIDAWTCQMLPEMLVDPRKRGENDEIEFRAQEIKDFIRGRREFIEDWRVDVAGPPPRTW